MYLKAALLATATASVFLLVAACGGGVDSNGGQSQPGSAGDSGQLQVVSGGGGSSGSGSDGSTSTNAPSAPSGSSGSSAAPIPTIPVASSDSGGSGGNGGSSSGNGSNCQRLTETTFIDGNLFVAEQGPVGITLLRDGGLTDYSFDFMYDYAFGLQSVSNQQNWWGSAYPFPVGTPVGRSTKVELQPPPPDLLHAGTVPSAYPKGIPVELWLTKTPVTIARERNSSSTASMHKDILGGDRWKTASVTYGPNNTAIVTFFATSEGPYFSVGLTNVYGTGCP